jgi:outer membrane receptor protein involved in Fe transport
VGSGDRTNGIPDRIFVCGLRNPFVTNGGSEGTFGSGRDLSFAPNGDLLISSAPTQNFVNLGGIVQSNDPLDGSTLRETGDLAVGQNRYAASLLGHFDVSDIFKPFIQATFVRQKAFEEFQPTFFQGDLHTFFEAAFGANVPSLTCDNGFLNAQALATLSGFGFCSAPDPVTGLRTGTVYMNRFNVDMGARKEDDVRTTYRIVAGFTGDFKNDWHYEVSFNYGHTKQDNQQHNDLFVQNPDGSPGPFALAVDAVAVLNGAVVAPGTPGSTIECRSTLTNPGNGCVPLDLFGEGAPSQAALHFVNRTSHLFQNATQEDALAFLSGDTQQWFSLPGGPVGFSIGVEHRRETAEIHADAISSVPGDTFFNAFPEFNPKAFVVSEAFGELNLPILKDMPFAHELTVSGAARYSHYSLGIGNTFAWNANAIWAPTRDLRLRANYSKSVRVPTLGDLFTPPTVNFAGITDPCDQFNINANPNFAANCAALGVPTTVTSTASPCFAPTQQGSKGPVGSPFHNCISNAFTLQVSDQGNPFLKPETGKSLTLGGVFTPRFIPGFSLSVDYFRISIEKVITQLGANTEITECVALPTIQNQFCPFVFPRDQFGLFASPAAIETGFNFAKRTARGIDFDLNYRRTFANGNRLSLRGIATYTLERTNFEDIVHPTVGNRILSELGDPVFSGTLIAGYGVGKFDFQYTARYIGSMTDFAFEDTHQFAPACNPDTGACPPFNSDVADHPNTGAVWYSDIRANYTIHNYQFYVGVDNVFNRLPPLRLTGAGSGSGIYSDIGRFFYAGAVLTFK